MLFSRYRAFAVHLLFSLGVGLGAAALVFFVWYPHSLASASGVVEIFLLMLAVDAVMGPCITLVIFNPAKKGMRELRRDLAIVAILQVSALLYGMHAVFVSRPAYIAYEQGAGFKVAYANDLLGENLALPRDESFRSPPWWGPKWVGLELPTDPAARSDVDFAIVAGGADALSKLPLCYVPYEKTMRNAANELKPLESLRALNAERVQDLDALIAKYAGRTEGVGYLPLKAKSMTLVVVLARDSGEVLEISPLSSQ